MITYGYNVRLRMVHFLPGNKHSICRVRHVNGIGFELLEEDIPSPTGTVEEVQKQFGEMQDAMAETVLVFDEKASLFTGEERAIDP